jgi:hypothetical protein
MHGGNAATARPDDCHRLMPDEIYGAADGPGSEYQIKRKLISSIKPGKEQVCLSQVFLFGLQF